MTSVCPRRFAAGRALGAALALTIALAGCSEAKKAIGWDKAPPDEFAVVARAPLSVPPDFQLRPPAPGTVRPQEGTPREQARGALTGSRSLEVAGRSQGEMALLQKSGSDRAEPDIRSVVNRELNATVEADRGFADRLIFWRKPDPTGTVLDPNKEAQRLRSNQALNLPVTEGDTPMIKRRKKGWLEGIF